MSAGYTSPIDAEVKKKKEKKEKERRKKEKEERGASRRGVMEEGWIERKGWRQPEGGRENRLIKV